LPDPGNHTLPTKVEELVTHLPKTRALYYEDAYLQEFEAKILKSIRAGEHSYVVLDRTSFFPEGGGQPGDQGTLNARGASFRVTDTRNVNEIVVHVLEEPFPDKETSVKGVIDWQKRYSNMKHHTAAHVIFSATRSALKLKNLRYMGFQISRDRVRLDLNRDESMTPVQIREIEKMTNMIALRQLPVKTSFTTRDEAVKRFGSELGLTEVTPTGDVRLVEIGDQEVSLCCGTHVRSTIELIPIKILARMRLQKGIERLEAAASEYGYTEFSKASDIVSKLSNLLDSEREDIATRVQQLLEERDKAKDEARKLRLSAAESEALQYLSTAETTGSFKVVTKALKDIDPETLKRMALKITHSNQDTIAILGSSGETTHLVVSAGANLLKRELNIGSIVKALAKKMGCRGGGVRNLAQAGGFPKEKFQELARQVRDAIIEDISREP
jgi:alanyl-tRNA synthetase